MDENKFWLRIWQSVIAGVCVLVATMAGCSSYKTSQAADLIRGGVDPLKVGCALEVGDGTTVRCAILTAK